MRIEPTWREFLPSLAPREMETFLLIGRGFSNEQIAKKMGISVLTVRHYAKMIHDKLYIEGRAALAIVAYQYATETSHERRV